MFKLIISKKNPINGIHNSDTCYQDITKKFNPKQIQQIWEYIAKIGDFKIARVGLKTNSYQDLIEGSFQIIEINLFTPMPLNLLDTHIHKSEKILFIKYAMEELAKTTKTIHVKKRKSIFFSMWALHLKIKS